MKKQRQSNMELLRIIAMFLVLVVHSDYLSLGSPTHEDIINAPAASVARVSFQAMALICVNLFVFISGWFGITLRRHKIADLLFQVFYYLIVIAVIAFLLGHARTDVQSLKELLVLGNWFIPAYLLLCLFAPALNAFIQTIDRRRFRAVLLCFFAIQTLCGWVGKASLFAEGYSTISFMGIYLLAQYIRKYRLAEKFSKGQLGATFAGCIAVNAAMGFANAYFGISNWLFWSYMNPFTIMATVSLALLFTKMSFQSSSINFIAKSAFSVYLLHINYNVLPDFMQINRDIFLNYSGVTVIVVIFFTCCVWFLAAIILDQPRKWLWNRISARQK